jgi:hypothetical protein
MSFSVFLQSIYIFLCYKQTSPRHMLLLLLSAQILLTTLKSLKTRNQDIHVCSCLCSKSQSFAQMAPLSRLSLLKLILTPANVSVKKTLWLACIYKMNCYAAGEYMRYCSALKEVARDTCGSSITMYAGLYLWVLFFGSLKYSNL